MENQVEIWKAHPDIDIIEVSTLGRVRTLDRIVPNGKGTRLVKGHVLKQRGSNYGYLIVNIPIAVKWATKYVHRLVAQTFIHNHNRLPMVNHKDCNRTNNNVSNLEWCTASYNSKYREKFGASLAESAGHPLFAINLYTNEVSHFRSQHEASRDLGVDRPSINMVIKGKRKQAGGFWFVSDDGHAVDVVKSELHDVGGTGLKIKHRATLKTH